MAEPMKVLHDRDDGENVYYNGRELLPECHQCGRQGVWAKEEGEHGQSD